MGEARWPLIVGPHALLLVLAALTAAAEPMGGHLSGDLALCLLTAVSFAALVRLRGPAAIALVAVMIALTWVLVLRHPWFGFLTPAAYVYVFRTLPWPWRPFGVAAVAVAAGLAQAYGVDPATPAGLLTGLVVIGANVVPMCAYTWVARRAERREAERERALAEAGEANRRLAASLAENAELQRRLLDRARDAGVLDERRRMAREIHDTLAQGLTGIVSQLRAAETAGDDWRGHVAAATALARESLTEARRSVHALRPEPLRSARLEDALAGVAARWSALHGIPLRLAVTGDPRPIRPEAEDALLRIAQEALANVARHARASEVGLTLSYLDGEAAVDVRDNGGGFHTGRRSGGFGLTGMRQRVESLSGTLAVESEPGHGTGVSARVPTEPLEARP